MDAKYRLFKKGQIVVDLARTRSRPFDLGLAALFLLPLLTPAGLTETAGLRPRQLVPGCPRPHEAQFSRTRHRHPSRAAP